MTKLRVRQKLFRLADQFEITDEQGQVKYTAKGAIFSWSKSCAILDSSGRELARIEQQLLAWMPKFHIYIGNEPIATIAKEMSFFAPRYQIDFGNIRVIGDPWRHNYSLEAEGRTIGQINKKFFTMADTYEIEILDDSLELIVLALVLSIDYVKAQQGNK